MGHADAEARSERIYLRALQDDDIDARYLSWFEEPDSLLDFYSSSGRQFTRDTILAELSESRRTKTTYFYAVVLNDGDLVIGNVKIGPISARHRTSDLVALIGDREYLGRGLAKEAIALGNAVAFERLDIRKLYGGMFAAHIASIKAYTAAGWVTEGCLKGQYLVDGEPMDRVLVACFNPKYFPDQAGDGS
jgi:ribosomal-protein-alanine N-acetyltransferase